MDQRDVTVLCYWHSYYLPERGIEGVGGQPNLVVEQAAPPGAIADSYKIIQDDIFCCAPK